MENQASWVQKEIKGTTSHYHSSLTILCEDLNSSFDDQNEIRVAVSVTDPTSTCQILNRNRQWSLGLARGFKVPSKAVAGSLTWLDVVMGYPIGYSDVGEAGSSLSSSQLTSPSPSSYSLSNLRVHQLGWRWTGLWMGLKRSLIYRFSAGGIRLIVWAYSVPGKDWTDDTRRRFMSRKWILFVIQMVEWWRTNPSESRCVPSLDETEELSGGWGCCLRNDDPDSWGPEAVEAKPCLWTK